MPNWSARLFFFGMVAFLIYVIMLGDGPKWYALLTSKQGATATAGGVTSTQASATPAAASQVVPLAQISNLALFPTVSPSFTTY